MKLISHPMLVIAIDPGLSGAVVRMGNGRLEARRDFKSVSEIALAVSLLSKDCAIESVVIEQVHAMPGQGVCSMFSFGKSTGVALGAITACGLRVVEVSPQKWQNWYRGKLRIPKKEKFDSCAIASKLLPAHAELFKRKKDHNTADAVLIGVWYLNQICSPSK